MAEERRRPVQAGMDRGLGIDAEAVFSRLRRQYASMTSRNEVR